MLALQLAQLPEVPQAVAVVPIAQVPLEQQPPLQGELLLQLVLQVFCTESQAWPIGQSAALLQPHLPATQAGPAALLVQSTHWVPLPPHDLPVVPGSHVPLFAAVQQPEPHGVFIPQEVTHTLLVHDELPFGQSLNMLQPHWPPPIVARQTWPIPLLLHEPQRPPPEPQAMVAVPALQTPALQQPPLQVWVIEQTVVHFLVLASHAISAGQSAATLQPQAPAMHCEPLLLPAQLAQRPEVPQSPLVTPVTHLLLPESQQPPLQVWAMVQVVVHCLRFASQA